MPIVFNSSADKRWTASTIEETEAEWDARHERQRASDERTRRHLANLDVEQAPWPNSTAMLSWFFAIADHMSSVPAIDPAAEVIQGLRVDKDERAWKIQSVRQALRHLANVQGGHTGHIALWLHLRPRILVKEFKRRGATVRAYDEPVALDQLFEAPALRAIANLTRRPAIQLYWTSLAVVDIFAYGRKWVAEQLQRRERKPQVYRRGE